MISCRGYCAPEYLHRGQVSFKSDIFSLGVIIIDLVTGRKEDPDIKNVRMI
jgi:coatomer subunit beta'